MRMCIKRLTVVLFLFFITGGSFPVSVVNGAPGDYLYKIGSTYTGKHAAGITVDGTGRVLVADYHNHRINVFDTAGNPMGYGGSYGTGNSQFKNPSAIADDGSGKIYITDYINNRVQVFNSAGNYLYQWGSFGAGNGQFDGPSGIVVDSTGKVFVLEVNNNRV